MTCERCLRPTEDPFDLYDGRGQRVVVGPCCALQLAGDIYRAAVAFGPECVNRDALNAADIALAVFAARFAGGHYVRSA